MDTDALIQALARDTRPVAPQAAQRRLVAGILLGAALAGLLLAGGPGIRSDLADAAAGPTFWGKGAYTASLGFAGLFLAMQLARPDAGRLRGAGLIAAPLTILSLFAAAEMALARPSGRIALVVEPRWICLPLVLILATPIFGGIVWAFRRLAPTRLAAAGAAAGLASGGFAATLYGLYCLQVSPTYVLTRYSVAIALASAAGALLGPRLLRW